LIDFTVALDKLDKIGEGRRERNDRKVFLKQQYKEQPCLQLQERFLRRTKQLSVLLAGSMKNEVERFICDNVAELVTTSFRFGCNMARRIKLLHWCYF
jgi:histidyl-tRNA synthetase